MHNNLKDKSGFSLVELILVIFLLCILAAVITLFLRTASMILKTICGIFLAVTLIYLLFIVIRAIFRRS